MKARRFHSKQHAMQSAVPVYGCASCRMKHNAPKVARCTKCSHVTTAMQSIPGVKRNTTCPNCARSALKNEHKKPFACRGCGKAEFIYFASTAEFNHFAQLAMLQDAGKITDLRMQVPFVIKLKGQKPICKYVADFVFRDEQGEQRIVDVKGHDAATSDVFKLKKKLVEAFYPGTTIEVVTP